MSNPYIKELFEDFSTKQNSIKTYLGKVNTQSKAIEDAVYQWLSLLKKKHEVIEEFRKSRQKMVPSSEFALESSGDSVQQTSNKNLQELENSITEKAQIINHLFQKAEKDLTFLTQSFKTQIEVVNNLDETFQQTFKGI